MFLYSCCCACRLIVTSNASDTREWNGSGSSIASRMQVQLFVREPHCVELNFDDDMPPLAPVEINESILLVHQQARDVVVEPDVDDDMPPLAPVERSESDLIALRQVVETYVNDGMPLPLLRWNWENSGSMISVV
jgi:hypothetical protein